MAEAVLGRPAEPVEDTSESSNYGGFADIAKRLNALHPERPIPISRQLVHRWWQCRGTNKFPEAKIVKINGRPRSVFDLAEVEQWHTNWLGERGINPPIETIPLFDIDRHGHPVDREQSSYRGHPEVRGTYRSSILDL